jgi:imidazolonepropionase-like amidohydrolase
MPGLIDAHWHAMMASLPVTVLLTVDVGYITLVAADEARKTLMRGFTSVRDMADPAFSLKRAIDQGVVQGPHLAVGRDDLANRRPRRLPPSL